MTTAIKGQKLTSFGTTSVENGTTSSSFVRGADLDQLELFIPSGLTVNGTANPDSITIYDGDDVVNAGEGGDVIYDFGTGNDIIRGEGGNDWIFVGKGNDTVDGGLGRDGISYLYSEQIVGLDLEAGFALSEGIDTLISIEDASGGAGNDSLLGSSVDNYLYGADGNDRLDGRGGNDSLWGGAGNDTVVGGTGSDFVFGDYGNDTLDGGADVDTLWGGWASTS
jgi:Ca2+-binding RTX toxin-like protein